MIRNPFVPTDGIHNLRDFGGYSVSGGGTVKTGLLFRSGQHVGASDTDLNALDGLDLGTVIDLRGNGERAQHPCRRSDTFNAEVIFYDGETSNMPPHMPGDMDLEAGTPIAQIAYDRMIATYTRMVHNPAMIELFQRYLHSLVQRDGGSLVHCFAGKDRTGVAVMLVQHILGVSREDQMQEFLLTNEAPTLHILRNQAVPGLEARYDRQLDEGAVRALLEVHGDYLDTYRAEVDRTAGSLDAYITGILGVDEAVQDTLRAKLIG
ncbi:MAG: tyrosine-protein phosphatase [Erythrobacter sp.]